LSNLIQKAVHILKTGGLVAFPTETVYGLGARLYDEKAIAKIFSVKGRPADNPLIVHISNKKEIEILTRDLDSEAGKLIEKFWPGPLTLVCKRSKKVPLNVTAGLETVAVRMPKHPIALKLLRALGEPIAAPSANRSGRPSPTRYEDVMNELGKDVDLVLSGGHTSLGLESTVVDVTVKPFHILREGFVTYEQLKKVVSVEAPVGEAQKKIKTARSPGMKHQHYKPNCKVLLVEPKEWKKSLDHWMNEDYKLGLFSCSQKSPQNKKIVFARHFKGDKLKFARHIYSTFFDAEKEGVEVLLVESMKPTGVGRAILDRLSRASQ